jgi:hypothetical protein
VVALAAGGYWGARTALAARVRAPAPPRVTQELVVEQVRSVARLVASEATLRDVVTYEQTRYWATKRALLVVTGRVGAGFVLDGAGTPDGGVDVRVDTAAKRIAVSLPPARVLSVEVLDVKTYDERAGLLNRFEPEDRDRIQRLVRERLERAGPEAGLLGQAERSATGILRTLLARDGYTVDGDGARPGAGARRGAVGGGDAGRSRQARIRRGRRRGRGGGSPVARCHTSAAPRRAASCTTASATALATVQASARPQSTSGPAGSAGGSSSVARRHAAVTARSAMGAAAALAATASAVHCCLRSQGNALLTLLMAGLLGGGWGQRGVGAACPGAAAGVQGACTLERRPMRTRRSPPHALPQLGDVRRVMPPVPRVEPERGAHRHVAHLGVAVGARQLARA